MLITFGVFGLKRNWFGKLSVSTCYASYIMEAIMYQSKLDNEGLVSLKDISCSGSQLYCGEQEIFVEPNVSSVFDYLMFNQSLKSISKVRCLESDICMKRALSYGVPFAEAFRKIQSMGNTKVQSSYQRTDWAELAKVGAEK